MTPENRRKLAGVCLRSRKARQLPTSNCARNNVFRERPEGWGNPEGYTIGDVPSRKLCPENSKYCWRAGKKFGVIDPIVRQVTTPSTSALDPWSDESVRKDQLADPEIKPIIEFKELSDEKPRWRDIAPFHPTTKRHWALWDSLHLRNGVLYRKWESDD
ncbi:gag-pol [Trichonephila clavipes]|nr:gag-pol [Trichonephila clavipes]